MSLRHSYDRVRDLWNNPVQIAFKTKGALKKAKKMTQEEIREENELFCKTSEARSGMYLEDRAFAEWEKATSDGQRPICCRILFVDSVALSELPRVCRRLFR